jgi:hypothetical protein
MRDFSMILSNFQDVINVKQKVCFILLFSTFTSYREEPFHWWRSVQAHLRALGNSVTGLVADEPGARVITVYY